MNQDSDFVLRSRIGVVLKPRTITRLEVLGVGTSSKSTRLRGPAIDAIAGCDDGELEAMTVTGIIAMTKSRARTPISTLDMTALTG